MQGTLVLPLSVHHSNLAIGLFPRRAFKVRVVRRDEGGGGVGQAHLVLLAAEAAARARPRRPEQLPGDVGKAPRRLSPDIGVF